MRLLFVQVAQGHGSAVARVARSYQDKNMLCFEASTDDGPADVFLLHLENDAVEAFLDELEPLPGLTVSWTSHEVLTLSSDAGSAKEQVDAAPPLSPIEVYLGGLKSLGSWGPFSTYALIAGALSWIGLFTNTVFLLIAAMLVAPYPSPALNAAVATARGDRRLLGRSLLRYFYALLLGVAAAYGLSHAFRQDVATDLMVTISYVSATAFLLPLLAGVAGGLFLSQSEESSLVSAAAAGVLVTAALSPPVAVTGMALALGERAMAWRAVFLLVLQIVGINLSGMLTFRMYNVSPSGAWYDRGRRWVSYLSAAATTAAFAGLLAWQFADAPALQRPTVAQDALALVQETVREDSLARLVAADVRFTTAEAPGETVIVGTVYVQSGPRQKPRHLARRTRRRIQERLVAKHPGMLPLIDVTALEPPRAGNTHRQPN